jgi:hypothetical protein
LESQETQWSFAAFALRAQGRADAAVRNTEAEAGNRTVM